jgi:hypothetical protein
MSAAVRPDAVRPDAVRHETDTRGAVGPLWPEMSASLRATLFRLAQRIGDGWSGEVRLHVAPNGGIRSVQWTEHETGDQIREALGIVSDKDTRHERGGGR